MKQLEMTELQNISGGDFLDGLCGGLLISEGAGGLLVVAVSYGWIAAIPGLNGALVVGLVATAVTCGIATL